MKTSLLAIIFIIASSFCMPPAKKQTAFFNYYNVELISNQGSGTSYDWVWKVTNPAPGNGLNGTLQDLSHWSLVLSPCVTQNDIVSASYSTDGLTWNTLSSTIAVDPSQNCYTAPVLKFNVGFPGTTTMYYRLTVNRAFSSGMTQAVFKSGKNTGCYVGMVEAMTCPTDDGGGVIR